VDGCLDWESLLVVGSNPLDQSSRAVQWQHWTAFFVASLLDARQVFVEVRQESCGSFEMARQYLPHICKSELLRGEGSLTDRFAITLIHGTSQ
jgi:hypothetical protein